MDAGTGFKASEGEVLRGKEEEDGKGKEGGEFVERCLNFSVVLPHYFDMPWDSSASVGRRSTAPSA
jgi:hypothetical protein